MNYIDEIFNRCNIDKIGDFLLYGTESLKNDTESYYLRSKNAYKNLDKWIKTHTSDFKEQNEQSSYIHNFAYEIENVYFQLGLQAGFMLAEKFYKKQ